jgi:hypothetical protein
VNPNLTSGVDLTTARPLRENKGVAFYADVKAGPFEIDEQTAREMLAAPNPDGRSNRDVVRPWINGQDLTGRPRGMWIVDFGVERTITDAAIYEAPFEYIRDQVRPVRLTTNRASYRERWWLHAEPVSGMRQAVAGCRRYIATPATAKHRLFVWIDRDVLADHAVVVVARDDDYTFGVLHSRVHEAWARGMGTQLREVESGFRYTPTTCFETFPFPHPTDGQRDAIADVARDLDRLRRGWLNPPWLPDVDLAKRTLTNLYNARPTWLAQAHDRLDAAVLAAYGWPADIDHEELLARLLALNLARAAA